MFWKLINWTLVSLVIVHMIDHSSADQFRKQNEFEEDDMSTAICSSLQCTCDYASKVASCQGLVFEYLPSFPTWIETLILNGNHLTLLRDNSFEGLTRLKRLYMSSSGLEYIESGAFRGMDQLTVLDLSHNRLYYWPSETFQPLTQLASLNLSANAFDDITIFTNLLPIGQNGMNELVIGENRFIRKSADFVRLPPTRRLVLAGSKFQSIIGRSVNLITTDQTRSPLTVRMDALGQADDLDLFDCGVQMDSTFFDSVHNIIRLNIGRNFMNNASSTLEKLKNFPRLQNLNVSGLKMDTNLTTWSIFPSSISSLDASSLGVREIAFASLSRRNTRLITLFASNNLIQTVHLTSALIPLRNLRLDGNRLLNFPTIDVGAKFESLAYLDLSDNIITKIEPNSLNAFPNLRQLLLSHNRLTHIHPSAFSVCCSKGLLKLDISHNSIENMPAVALASLNILDLSSNRLLRIDNGTIAGSKRLEVLDISFNPVLMQEMNLFACSDDYDDRRLNEFNQRGKSLSITWLDELANLTYFKRLSARGVGLSRIPVSQFSKMLSRVEHFDISENHIPTDQWEAIASSIPKKGCLRTIGLRRNRLTGLKNLTVFDNGCLEKLDLSENPFDCNCHLEPVYALLKSLPNSEKGIYNESIYYCFSPSNYYRYPLYEFISTLQPCSYYESNQSIASSNGLRIILATFLSLVAVVLLAVLCRASLATAIRYGFNIRQNMYKPLRVIISGSSGDLASPVML